jgi:guanylate kinase
MLARVTPRLTVLSGPSGVGKGTVVEAVRELHPEVWLSVSVTTRKPRPGERLGVHYHFLDDAAFDQLVADGDLLEHATYTSNRYGTPRGPVLAALAEGRPALLEIDLQGARQVRQAMPEARLVFLSPPSWDELVRRLTGRSTEEPAVIERRLEQARLELAAEPEFDAVLINDDVRSAASRLVDLMTGPS